MENEVIENFHKMRKIENKLKNHKNHNHIIGDYHPIYEFNYSTIPATSFVEEIYNFERNFGECEYINNKSRFVCQAIDNSLKTFRNECDQG